jgi:hypothetical protein
MSIHDKSEFGSWIHFFYWVRRPNIVTFIEVNVLKYAQEKFELYLAKYIYIRNDQSS